MAEITARIAITSISSMRLKARRGNIRLSLSACGYADQDMERSWSAKPRRAGTKLPGRQLVGVVRLARAIHLGVGEVGLDVAGGGVVEPAAGRGARAAAAAVDDGDGVLVAGGPNRQGRDLAQIRAIDCGGGLARREAAGSIAVLRELRIEGADRRVAAAVLGRVQVNGAAEHG